MNLQDLYHLRGGGVITIMAVIVDQLLPNLTARGLKHGVFIKTKDITKRFGAFTAVDHVSMGFPSGRGGGPAGG